ncbi:MAG: response regulator [Bacteroidota bacterium]|nr:response regulator [Bacteroidota bacterium]
MVTPQILIVEDDMMMRAIFELYSEQSGFECVASVHSGEDALKKLEHTNVDVIIIDIFLKTSMTGIELVEKIEEKYDIPIIFITAKIDENLITNNISRNVYGFLFKPLHKNNFKSTVNFALSKHKFNKKNK